MGFEILIKILSSYCAYLLYLLFIRIIPESVNFKCLLVLKPEKVFFLAFKLINTVSSPGIALLDFNVEILFLNYFYNATIQNPLFKKLV